VGLPEDDDVKPLKGLVLPFGGAFPLFYRYKKVSSRQTEIFTLKSHNGTGGQNKFLSKEGNIMKQHPDGCIDWRIFVISLVVALACACATLPPAQPIRDHKDIAGKWEGTIFSTTLGSSPIVLIISEDGTRESIVPQSSAFWPFSDQGRFLGTWELVEGKIRTITKTTGDTGIFTLHEGGGKRVLVYRSDDGYTRSECTPAQK